MLEQEFKYYLDTQDELLKQYDGKQTLFCSATNERTK